jgi:predicted nucleic acid-binding protein
MIVVDTNVIVYLTLTSDRTHDAQRLRAADPYWIVPMLWSHEYLNVVVQHVRRGMLDQAAAVRLWQATHKVFHPREQAVNMVAALRLACENDVTGYDAQFVALAEHLDLPLVTDDKKVLRAFEQRACSITEYLDTHTNPGT